MAEKTASRGPLCIDFQGCWRYPSNTAAAMGPHPWSSARSFAMQEGRDVVDVPKVAPPIPRKTLFLYGVSEMPLQVSTLPVLAFIPNFYIQDLGLSAALVGTAMLLSRLLDIVTDPIVGVLSDRTGITHGRRRVWMVAGLPVAMLGVYALFFPPGNPGILWFFVATSILWLGWTIIFIPYYAWAAELSSDYNERSRITGWRTSIGLVATIVAQVIPVVALTQFGYGGTPAVITIMGIMLLILLPTTIAASVLGVAEQQRQGRTHPASHVALSGGLRLMLDNGPFKRLVFAFFIVFIGMAGSATLFIFFVRGVLGEEDAGIGVLLVNFIAGLASVPFWIWLSKRIGKHRAWMYSLILMAAVNPFLFFLGEGDLLYLFPIIAVTGFAVGAVAPLTNSMKADVIDLDRVRSGENRTGQFFAAWSMVTKLSLALGPALVLWLLDIFSFESAPGLIQDQTQSLILTSTYVLSPIVCSLVGAAIMRGYPITEKMQQELREKLEEREVALAD
ncbi:MAG: MFS transporter [Dermatophilaceae bacterium]